MGSLRLGSLRLRSGSGGAGSGVAVAERSRSQHGPLTWDATQKKWNIPTTGAPNTTLAVIHSQKTSGVAEITCDHRPIETASTGTVYTKNGTTCPTSGAKKTYAQLYTENDWYRSNTREDLAYLTGMSAPPQKVVAEFAVSEPRTADEKTNLCPTKQTYWTSLAACQPSDLVALYLREKSDKIYTPDTIIE